MSAELVVAGFSFLLSLGSVLFAARIDREQKDRDALRAYRFDAAKRLYEQCEPVLFQLAEAAGLARSLEAVSIRATWGERFGSAVPG